jgi:hypothetical protein
MSRILIPQEVFCSKRNAQMEEKIRRETFSEDDFITEQYIEDTLKLPVLTTIPEISEIPTAKEVLLAVQKDIDEIKDYIKQAKINAGIEEEF